LGKGEKRVCFWGRTNQKCKFDNESQLPYSLIFVSFVGLFMLGSESLLFANRLRTPGVSSSGIGIFSSPRVTDLNGDGIGDIVFGAGRTNFMPAIPPSSR